MCQATRWSQEYVAASRKARHRVRIRRCSSFVGAHVSKGLVVALGGNSTSHQEATSREKTARRHVRRQRGIQSGEIQIVAVSKEVVVV